MSDYAIRARDLHQSIREILVGDWDPIGIRAIAEAADEYDSYVPEIYSMLIKRRSAGDISDFLLWVETEHMGLAADRQKTRLVAEKIAGLTRE